MRLQAILLTAAVLVGFCQAQTSNGTVAGALPACGITCLVDVTPESGCAQGNFTCICQSQKFADLATKCVVESCSLDDAFTMVKFQAKICNYGNESRTQELKIVTYTLGIMTKVVIALRVCLRLYSQGALGVDDWLMLVAMVSDSTAFYAMNRLLAKGYGEHIWNINPGDVNDILFWFYIILIFYMTTNGIIKLSILAFYLRIFMVSKRFTVLCWIHIAFCAGLTISFVFISIFQCTPLANAWKLAPDGYCINFHAAAWSYSSINVLQDVIIIVLPIMEVYALQMSLRKKIGIVMIFVIGGFVAVASAIRLSTLPGFGRTSDPTWTNQPAAKWSSIELGVGMICASIPSIYSGLRRVWPDFRDFTRKHISMRGSKPSNETGPGHQKQSGLSGIPSRVRYFKAKRDPISSASYEMESRTSLVKSPGLEDGNSSWTIVRLDKPMPAIPKNGAIEASTTVSVVRAPRS